MLDVVGNVREVIDARANTAEARVFGMLGQVLESTSVDAGMRRVLTDVGGALLRSWNSRGFVSRVAYDMLRRPTHLFVTPSDRAEMLVTRTLWGEDVASAEVDNLRTRVLRIYDGAGVLTSEAFDFKGNLLRQSRRLAVGHETTRDWLVLEGAVPQTPAAIASIAEPELEAETFAFAMQYDALNRVTSRRTSDDSETLMTYNQAGLLEAVDVRIRGAVSATTFVSDFDYNARGQRLQCVHGNGTTATYAYDPNTFRLARLRLVRDSAPTVSLQDLRYTYDPVGNITQIRDGAQQTTFFSNAIIQPEQLFEYDPLYRLIVATGREHMSLSQPTHLDISFGPQPGDPLAIRNYEEHYVWDEVGNILELQHVAAGGNFTRQYVYADDGNRLLSSSAPGEPTPPFSNSYTYDAHGNMTAMPHLATLDWDHADRLQHCDLGGGGDVWFVYDAQGNRVRKVQVNQSGSTTRERIYLGDWEVWRERTSGGVQQERETLHIADDTRRICLVETPTVNDGEVIAAPTQVHRYQHGNHLGSATLELDENAAIISYEEFHPFGTTSYAANDSGIEVSAKRYRYIGKEKDEETGLYHCGARYLSAWLGSWAAADPIGLGDGVNRYAYSRGNPVALVDPGGKRAARPTEAEIRAMTPEEFKAFQRSPESQAELKGGKLRGGKRSEPAGGGAPDTGGAGIGSGNRRVGRKKEPPPPPPPASAEGAAGDSGTPGSASPKGEGATWFERLAAAFAVVGGGRINFGADKTKLGLGETENPGGSGLPPAFVIAAVVTKEVLAATALGLAGRLLGGLGSVFRKVGAERLAAKLDEIAESMRAAKNNIGDDAAEGGAGPRLFRGVPGPHTARGKLGQQGIVEPRGTALDEESLRQHVLAEDVDAGVTSWSTSRTQARRFSGSEGTIIEVEHANVADRVVPRPNVGKKYEEELEVLLQGRIVGKPTKP